MACMPSTLSQRSEKPALPTADAVQAQPGQWHWRDSAAAGPDFDLDGDALVRTLATNEMLFSEGDRKTHLYRVESGAICVYVPGWKGHRDVSEFVFPGDLVGLGFLEHHASSARAMVETRVSCFHRDAQADLVEGDPRAEAKLADAVEREFESRRDRLVESGRARPLERVAAFLTALSRNNTIEGRDPCLITDSWQCGTIANFLTLSVDGLASILVELEGRGLIEPCPPLGLRLKDVEGLEKLAAGLCSSEAPEAAASGEAGTCPRRPSRLGVAHADA
ncbi:MAG TPA: Crp/Fnr family transcriptional regulator [Hyphomicrobiaceae bacterium]|nr:Crp/Fnr family transcriptional regulator [Hyphomicrobiaceae bacterium]